jgi:glycosyltransferase A (GT-A) superfamily protein (DUF2064 family)
MKLEINQAKIEEAIQAHLDKMVTEGIDWQVKEQLNKAIGDAITPEIVKGYADAAIKAMTSPDVTQRIVTEMNDALAEAVRQTMQEAVVAVVVKLRTMRRSGSSMEMDQMASEVRNQLFPQNSPTQPPP